MTSPGLARANDASSAPTEPVPTKCLRKLSAGSKRCQWFSRSGTIFSQILEKETILNVGGMTIAPAISRTRLSASARAAWRKPNSIRTFYFISGVLKNEMVARPRLASKWNRGTCR
jgi:hypothetical protein